MSETQPLAAVTGATGFTGGAIARRLLAEGYRVRALAREPRRLETVQPQIEPVAGDLSDGAALARLVDGAELVIHVAAMFRTEGPRQQFLQVNHRGTQNVLAAAQAAGVRRFVHCSSIGVHGHVDSSPADERSPFNPRDNYQESKVLAEEACWDEAGRGDMQIVIVRPCSIYGPGDLRMLKMFRMLVRGVFVMIGDGRANFHPVYIDDLVDAFVAAARTPEAAGETFIVGGPRYLALKEYVTAAAAAVGVKPPRTRLPYALMEAAAWASEAVCRPLAVEPPLHRRRLRFFKHNRAFRIDHARNLLKYAPLVDVEDGLLRTAEWYRREGLLPNPTGARQVGRRPYVSSSTRR